MSPMPLPSKYTGSLNCPLFDVCSSVAPLST